MTAIRYVERNPVVAGLVAQAQDRPWSSAGGHGQARAEAEASDEIGIVSPEFPRNSQREILMGYRAMLRKLRFALIAAPLLCLIGGCELSGNRPFLMVQICVVDDQGVSFFKSLMRDIAQSEGIVNGGIDFLRSGGLNFPNYGVR